MAKVDAKRCDVCKDGVIHEASTMTRRVTQYKRGRNVEAQKEDDLCPTCAKKEIGEVDKSNARPRDEGGNKRADEQVVSPSL